MIIVSMFLIGGAVALLLLGLQQPSSAMLIASIGSSVLAALVLVTHHRRLTRGGDEYAMDWQPRHASEAGAARRASSDTVRLLDLPVASDPSDPSTSRAPAERVATAAGHGAGMPRASGYPELTYPGIGALPSEDPAVPQQGRLTVELPEEIPDGSTTGSGAADAEPEPADRPDLPTQQQAVADEDAPAEDAYLADEPAAQQVSAADAARVGELDTEVLVVDGRPRYHLSGCVHLLGRDSEPLPVSEALELGFSPCSLCEPDSALLADAGRV